MNYNEGLFKQIKNFPNFSYKKENKIQQYHIVDAMFYVKIGVEIKYTENRVMSWEELDLALEHYKFLRKYNLL